MFATEAYYENGKVLFKTPPPRTSPSRVIVTFLDNDEPVIQTQAAPGPFSFEQSKEILKGLKSSLSDAIIEERRG